MQKLIFSRGKDAAIGNIKLCFKVSVILALVSAVLRSIAYLVSFDSEIGYFNGSFFATAVNYLIILACVFALGSFVYISKQASLPNMLDNSGNAVFFSSVFAGFIMIADFAYKIYAMIGEDKFSYYKFILDPKYKAEDSYFVRAKAIIEIVGVLASLLAAICFFLRSSKKANGKLCTWLGFFPIARALSSVAQIYFEMEVQMNHPSKLMLQFALIAIMIYFLCEMRFYVSEDHPRPRRFFVCGCIAYILAISAGVSEMVGFFFGSLSRGDFCIEAFFCFTMSFYILSRVSSFVQSAETAPKATNASVTEESSAE